MRLMLGPKKNANGEWRSLVREIKSRRLRWASHVARIKGGRSAFKILRGKFTGKRSLGSPWGLDGRTILG